MISSSREKEFQAKADSDTNNSKFNTKAPSSSRQWSAFKNPRIAHISRAFGGKDRHTKVCTIRGLRDRRIRLSGPTAIQLYDLQDRLHLGQPSKVVEWLMDATKHEIDKLPPLQMPPGSFDHFHQPNLVSSESNAPQSSFSSSFNANSSCLKDGGAQSLLLSKEGIRINCNVGDDQMMGKSISKAWESDEIMGAKLKEAARENIVEKTKWMRANDPQNQDGSGGYIPQVQNLFPIASHSTFPNLLYNSMPFNSFYHRDPSNLSLSQFGSHGYPFQTEGANTSQLVSLPSSLALPSGSQLFLCPPAATPSVFSPYPPYITAPAADNDTRQINHFLPNTLMSSFHSSSSRMSSTSKVLHLHSQNDGRQPNKGNTGS